MRSSGRHPPDGLGSHDYNRYVSTAISGNGDSGVLEDELLSAVLFSDAI